MKLNIFQTTIFIVLLIAAGAVFAQTSDREKGIELYQSGDYKTALESFQKAVEADTTDGEAWRFLGMIYARTGNWKQANDAFNKADDYPVDDSSYDTPLKFISKPLPKYTQDARQANEAGTVDVVVEFGSDGKIKFIYPFKKLRYGLTEKAIEAAEKIKFEPAIRHSQPVTVIKIVKYNFAIY